MKFSEDHAKPLEDRSVCVLRLLTAALIGSLVGAVCAKTVLLLRPAWFSLLPTANRTTDFPHALLLSLLFPALLLAARFLGARRLFLSLFFLKSAFVSALLCLSSGSGFCSVPAARSLLLRTALPLGVLFFTASCLMTEPQRRAGGSRLILLNLLAAVGSVLLDLLFSRS